ncbi:polysaccharide deacetylase family protein [Planotetraspora kaengkrachanensis]|uniref:Xylanase n=1 Tax=Planotetraspora kaengkrachanensis TaxID=575193 RepID=A0A8J3M0R4_9ACTN|nr:polysaccharide deacetylase family protein [Planotetraspora kaengkrachanensis]GIG76941.1 xylanase [Planotetraspora kaengkrachanensis]
MTVRSLARAGALANAAVVAVGLVVVALLPSSDQGAPEGRTRITPVPAPSASRAAAQPSAVESARKVKANEAGLIPVIMYHRLMTKRRASIDRTPKQLRAELERLVREKYAPITAAEFVSGKFNVPAGMHPVVLTFDDGSPSHFALDAHGNPKKNTAVEIIYEVAKKHPGFRPVATFWVNRNPFGIRDKAEEKRAVGWLVGHGFEVANHTYTHPDLHRLKTKKVSEQIVKQERLLKGIGVPSSTTFALPYGSAPKKRTAAREGAWDGTKYHFDGVFLASARPSVSPYAKGFDRTAIPRVQSNEKKTGCPVYCTQYWLDWLNKRPGERYTSDGDPAHISVPKKLRGKITPSRAKSVIAY